MANENQPVEKKQDYVIDIISDDKGKVQIANVVIAAIIQKYVLTVDGVMRMAPQGLLDGLASIFSRRGYDKNIVIDSTEEGTVITLALNLKFGCNIPEVTSKVQSLLFETIPNLTGHKVSKVNIMVAAIEEELPKEEEQEEPVVPIQTI